MASLSGILSALRFDLSLLAAFQIMILAMYGFFVDYNDAADASVKVKNREMDVSYASKFYIFIAFFY